MPAVIIEAEGPGAEAALTLAADFFAAEFGVKATPRAIEAQTTTKGLGPEWWAVILAIPGAILAVIDLTARARLIERTSAMLADVRSRLGTASGVIRIGARKTFDIATAKARDIIDALLEEDDNDNAR